MKVIILVQSSDKLEYVKLREAQQQTWDTIYHPNVKTFYFKRNNKNESIDGNFINTTDGPEWFNMYRSFVKTLRLLLIKQDFDYVFKTDNSAYINKEILYNLLVKKPRTNYFGGMIYPHKCTEPFVWGEGFAISKDIAQFLVDKFNKSPFLFNGLDDAVVTKLLKDKTVFDDTLHICEINSINVINPKYHVYRIRINNNEIPPSIIKPENFEVLVNKDIDLMYNFHNIITNGKSNSININQVSYSQD